MSIIASATDPRTLSDAHQAIAIVLRDRGQADSAIAHGFTALRYARHVDAERQGDVLATLGPVLIYAGRTREGLRRLQEALPLTPSTKLPYLFLRRAHAFAVLARYDEALHDVDLAVTGSHHLGDTLWEGRALNNRCDILLALGRPDEVDADAIRAEQLLSSIGQEFEAAQAVQSRALAAHERGDIPTALDLIDQAIAHYQRLGNTSNDLAFAHISTLLTAGLSHEALRLGERILAEPEVAPIRRAELLLATAKAALATGNPASAERTADQAARLFAAQLRQAWAGRARLLRLRAQFVSHHPELVPWMAPEGEFTGVQPAISPAQVRRLIREATEVVDSLRAAGSPEVPVALLLRGRLARDAGLDTAAERDLLAAADSRRSGPPLSREAGWLAAAQLAEHRGDRRALYLACRRGLDAVDEYRSVLGDLELRALASGHGLEFFQLAVAQAVRSNRPRELLWWTERWRAAALNGPRTRPQDPTLRRALASLRDVTRRLDITDDDLARAALTRERARHENTIRRALHHQRGEGAGVAQTGGLDLDAVFAELGDEGALVTIVRVGSELHLLVAARHRVRHQAVGDFAAATKESEFARLALRRAAYGRHVDLDSAGSLLQEALLGADFALPPSTRYAVVVPPAHLLTAPWGLVPAFRDTVLAVSPSVSQWLRARRQRNEAGRHVALVTGPNLTTREAEVSSLSRLHPRTKVLHPDQATVSAAMDVIEGARLAHIAAHGVFRGDAPLFSALMLADGPLTVHDLRQLEHPPTSFVLSACDSGGAAPIGPFEALGLVASLLGMGTSSVLASVVPVNDQACLGVMADVHAVVARDGGTVAEGWLAARRAAASDDLAAATAASFTAWGA